VDFLAALPVLQRVQRGEQCSVPSGKYSTCQWLFGICYREEKIYPDGGRPRCGKPCAEDSLRKVIRQERPEILC